MEARSIDLAQMSHADKLETVRLLEEARNRQAQRLFYALFPDEDERWTGPSIQKGLIQTGQTLHARHKYAKHMEFFRAGAKFPERCAMCANRIGKTMAMGGYEMACHLTGDYPEWWPGRRFKHPISAWAAGKGFETTRDIMQLTLLGNITHRNGRKTVDGRGVIPGERLGQPNWKSGVADLVDTIMVRHESGGWSDLGFKCHPTGSRVLMADGVWQPIERIKLGEFVRSPDGKARPVTQLHAYTSAPVLRVRTRCGSIEATPNHPMLTDCGWIDAGKLTLGDVMVLRHIEHNDPVKVEDWEVVLTAVMIGDGCTRGKTPFFSCNEPVLVDMIRAILPDDLCVVPVANTISYKISSTVANNNRLTKMLRRDGLWGLKALTKFIPDWVFRLPESQRILFLRWLWTCDGTVNDKLAAYASSSPKLIQQVRLLLHSVGIYAPIENFNSTCNGKTFPTHRITLYGNERIEFMKIGKLNRDNTYTGKPRPKGPRGEIIGIEDVGEKDVYCVGVDEVHELIVDGFVVGNSYEQGRGSFEGTGKHVCLSEGELVQMADGTLRPIEQVSPGDFVLSIGWRGEVVKRRVAAVHDNGLRDCVRLIPKQGTPVVLTPDHEVYWGYEPEQKVKATDADKIVQIGGISTIDAIEPAGMRRVYDLSVDTEHRYLAGTNLVSNCWLDEEPPMDVYGECLIRTATTQGIIYITFTPLEGMSHVVLSFLPADQRPDFEVE